MLNGIFSIIAALGTLNAHLENGKPFVFQKGFNVAHENVSIRVEGSIVTSIPVGAVAVKKLNLSQELFHFLAEVTAHQPIEEEIYYDLGNGAFLLADIRLSMHS